ncbi:MAG TPA: N-acetylmuramoyl-L-alanine amidase [Sutterella sp.]|nr:N-acetylmuramoyl-L-alanine amidase [Sutterella sp.]
MTTSRRLFVLGTMGVGLSLTGKTLFAANPSALTLSLKQNAKSLNLTITTRAKILYRTYYLGFSENRRFVVDMEPMTLTPEISKAVAAIKPLSSFARSVRVGQFQEDTVRLVIDLADGIDAAASSPTVGLTQTIRVNLSETTPDDPLAQIVSSSTTIAAANAAVPDDDKPKPPIRKAPPAKRKQQETLIVVIDPGHGGVDPGAVGRRKTKEKTVVLAIAKQLAARINATRGMKAYLTRNTDIFLPLHKRAALAIKHRAHLFVSVHADAWTNPKANGSSVFTLSTHGASSLQARWLAQTQNKSDEIGGMDFRDVASQARSTVVDMLAETKLRYGIQLGDAVLEELSRLGPLHKSTVEYAEFAVLKAQGVPSILIETAFISNPKDEKRLTNKREQSHFATAIYKGILTAVERDPSLLKQS